jgi:hypothetical protein
MSGALGEALAALVTESLPGLFGGASPPVRVTVASELLELDPRSADAAASEPRPDDQVDELSFDPADPAGPYLLTRPPYPGPRRVRLVAAGERVPLRDAEVVWDDDDPRRFTLQPRPSRDLTGVTAVEVLYGVTAVYTKLGATQTLGVSLRAAATDEATLGKAEALVVAVIALNRQRLLDDARAGYQDGDYGADVEVRRLRLLRTTPADGVRLLTVQADLEVKASRALREDEGRPIERIRTPGRPLDPDRPVDIHIDVEA